MSSEKSKKDKKKSKKRKNKGSDNDEDEDEPFLLLALPSPIPPVVKKPAPTTINLPIPESASPQQQPVAFESDDFVIETTPTKSKEGKQKGKMIIVEDSDEEGDEVMVLAPVPPAPSLLPIVEPSPVSLPEYVILPEIVSPIPKTSISVPIVNLVEQESADIVEIITLPKITSLDRVFSLIARHDICMNLPDLCNVIHRMLQRDIGLKQSVLLIEMEAVILQISDIDDARIKFQKFIEHVPPDSIEYLRNHINNIKGLSLQRKQDAKVWLSDVMMLSEHDIDTENLLPNNTIAELTGKVMKLQISSPNQTSSTSSYIDSPNKNIYAIDIINAEARPKKFEQGTKEIPIRICNDIDISAMNIVNIANIIMDLTVERNMPVFRRFLEQELFKCSIEELCGMVGDILNLISMEAIRNPTKLTTTLAPLMQYVNRLNKILPSTLPLNVYRSLKRRNKIKSILDNQVAVDVLNLKSLDQHHELLVQEIGTRLDNVLSKSGDNKSGAILNVLYKYQEETVRWMCEREIFLAMYPKESDNEYCGIKGGIINLLPGMGKTRIAFAEIFIATHPKLQVNKPKGSINNITPTLIITPLNVLFDWRTELKKVIDYAKQNNLARESNVKVFFWHKSADGTLSSESEINRYDIIITTYSTVMSSFRLNYQRIISDKDEENVLMSDIFKAYPMSKKKYKRIRDGNIEVKQIINLADEDIMDVVEEPVIIEKETLGNKDNGLLHRMKWQRIICDESHVFANYKTLTFASMVSLMNNNNYNAIRFCLTGTPFRNRKTDLVSQLYFCGYRIPKDISLLSDIKTMKTSASVKKQEVVSGSILDVSEYYSFDRVGEHSNCLLPSVYSLQYGNNTVKLPELHEEKIEFELSDLEMTVYDQYRAYANRMYTLYVNKQGENIKYATLFAAITRMRQCAIAPYLVYKNKQPLIEAILNEDVAVSSTSAIIDTSQYEFVENESISGEQLLEKKQQLKEKGVEETEKEYKALDEIIESDHRSDRAWLRDIDIAGISSSRITKVIEILTKIYRDNPNDKTLIFSNYVTALALVQLAIRRLITNNNTTATRIISKLYIGSLPQNQRQNIRQQFSTNPDFKIMLISYGVGEAGLNLQDANRVIMLDDSWNEGVRLQALSRTLRIGQKKPVWLYSLHAIKTIDDRIEEIRLSKKAEWTKLRNYQSAYQLAESVNKSEVQKLDLRKIFE